MTAVGTLSPAAIEQRIEGLRLSRWHWTTLGVLGVAQGVEAIDALAASFALPVFIEMWSLTPTMAGLLLSAMYTGQMLGAGAAGWLSDRYGRMRLLRWSMLGLVLLGLIVAAAWSYQSFLVLRFLQGLAMGGVLLLTATYLGEVSGASFRGKLIFGLNLIFSIGVLIASLIATYIVPNYGWRWVFIIAAAFSIPFFVFGRRLPESPRWLASQGHVGEASVIVDAMESRAPAYSGGGLSADTPQVSRPTDRPGGWADLLAPAYRARSALLWLMALSVGIIGTSLISWLPTFYREAYKISLESTLGMSSISFSASLVGSIVGALVVDRLRRGTAMLLSFGGMTISLVLLWRLIGVAPLGVTVGLAFSTILFQVILLFSLSLVMVEFYPTRLRGIGAGACRVWLGISAIVGPLSAGAVVGAFGISAVMAYLLTLAAAGLVAAFLLNLKWPELSVASA